MTKKKFQIGTVLEDNTEYYATESEYHVYAKDTVTVSDDRYVALRAHDTKAFEVFMLIKDRRNITVDFGGATLVMHGKIQPFLVDFSQNVTIKNCNVTYSRPPYTEALITEVTPEYVRLRLRERCTCRIEDGKLVSGIRPSFLAKTINRNSIIFFHKPRFRNVKRHPFCFFAHGLLL